MSRVSFIDFSRVSSRDKGKCVIAVTGIIIDRGMRRTAIELQRDGRAGVAESAQEVVNKVRDRLFCPRKAGPRLAASQQVTPFPRGEIARDLYSATSAPLSEIRVNPARLYTCTCISVNLLRGGASYTRSVS